MGTISTMSSQSSLRHMPISIGADVFAEVHDLPFRLWVKLTVAMVVGKLQKRRSRLHLRNLSDQQLHDIGVTRHQANQESNKVWF